MEFQKYWTLFRISRSREHVSLPHVAQNNSRRRQFRTHSSVNSRRLDESLILESHQSGLSSDSAGSQLPVIPSQDETNEMEEEPAEESRQIKPDLRQESVSSGMTNGDSRAASFDETTNVRKVAVSVHDERKLLPTLSLRSTNDFIEVLVQGKQDTATAKTGEVVHSGAVTKSSSGDTQIILGVSSSASGVESNAAILGASTSSLTSIPNSATYRQPPPARHRRFAAGCIDENDLSMPYNHYRCLSPNEHHGTCSAENLRHTLGARGLHYRALKFTSLINLI